MRMNKPKSRSTGWAMRTCRTTLGAACLLLWACGDAETTTPLPPDAKLPGPAERSGFEPEILTAFDTATASVRSSPTPANWALLGRIYHAHEQLLPAIDSYREAIKAGDATNRTAHLMALALDEIGNRAEALSAMQRADTLRPTNPTSTWRLGQWLAEEGDQPGAEATLLRALAATPDDFGCQLAYGKFLLDSGRPQEALQPLARTTMIAPNVPYPRFLLGTAMQQVGMEQEAEKQLKLGRGSVPSWPDRHKTDLDDLVRGPKAELSRLVKVSDGGNPAQALPAMLQLRERMKSDPNYHVQLAKVHRRLNQMTKAEEALAVALELQAEHPDAIYQLAGLKHQRWLATPDRDPGNPFLGEALALAERSIAIRPNDANSHAVRAQVLASMRRLDESSAAWMLADSLDNGRQKFEFMATKVYIDAGEWDVAVQRLEALQQKYPNDLLLQREFGLTLFKAGQLDYARAVLQSISNRFPEDREVQAALKELP